MQKTIEQLEKEVWGEPQFDSHVVVTCHRLRKKPISEFGVEDLRLMIGQNIGTIHILPRALEVLETDPLVWDYHFEGELLAVLLALPPEFWSRNRDQEKRLTAIVTRAGELLKERRQARLKQVDPHPGNDVNGDNKHEAWLLSKLSAYKKGAG